MLHSCILAARSLNNIDMHCPYCTWASGRPYSSQTPTGNVSEDTSQFITLTTEFWTYLTIGMVQLSGSSTIEYYEVSGGGVHGVSGGIGSCIRVSPHGAVSLTSPATIMTTTRHQFPSDIHTASHGLLLLLFTIYLAENWSSGSPRPASSYSSCQLNIWVGTVTFIHSKDYMPIKIYDSRNHCSEDR
jgi:hypothetical protein